MIRPAMSIPAASCRLARPAAVICAQQDESPRRDHRQPQQRGLNQSQRHGPPPLQTWRECGRLGNLGQVLRLCLTAFKFDTGDSDMIEARFLKILVCPENRSALMLAEPSLLGKLNAAISRGELRNRGGQPIESSLKGALVREDFAVAYPIVDDIPMLLVDEGILLSQLSG
jgi:uncharacterized protein YbaR (Trm112 family)